ncbi:unnamed protein product [Alopecurus aequalis]
MIGGVDENDAEDVRPSARTTTPPSPPSSSSPIAPSSSPAQQTGLGRRLLSSIRALASHPAPAPAAAAAPKVGLGLLLHLRSDHPCLHPTPSASPSAPEKDEAALARPHAAAARPHSPLNRYRLGVVAATSAPANVYIKPADKALVDGHGQDDQNCASDKSGASEEENLVGDKEKVGEQQGAVHRKGTSFVKDVDAAGDDQEEKLCTGDRLRAARDGDHERDDIHPRDGTTWYGIAAGDDQQKVEGRSTAELGSAENDDDDAVEDKEAVEQCVIDTAMDGDSAVKDHEVVGQSVIARIEMHATIDVQDQHNGVDATVNGSDKAIWKKKVVKLPYPQRPGKPNCQSYMVKGSCSDGFYCQSHHPLLKAKPDSSWYPSEQGNHGVADILELNRIGLPIRKGARICTYYMRNGACRYGKRCHFNHPEHVIDAQFYAPAGWEDTALELERSSDHHTTLDDTSRLKKSSDNATLYDTSYSKKSSDRATSDDTSYSKKSSDHASIDDTSYSKKSSDRAILDDTTCSKKSSDHATIDDTSCSSEVLPPNIIRMLLPPPKVLPGTERKVMELKKDSNWSSTLDDSDGCCSADSSDGPLCKQEHVDNSDGPLRKQEQLDYPQRPGEPECPFYMKNRFCRFGAKCSFNHPKDSNPTLQSLTNAKKSVATDERHQSTRITLEVYMPQQQRYPERPGQPDCRYYLQFGKCKFLSACIFHHPRERLLGGWNPSGSAHSDQIGPEIHGMPECPFYTKSGKCQFGSACEFRHPKDIRSTTEGAFGHRTDLANDNITRPENVRQKQEQTMYPERPGEPRCFNYMRHGSCTFQMNCKYHHPADRHSRKQYDSTYH